MSTLASDLFKEENPTINTDTITDDSESTTISKQSSSRFPFYISSYLAEDLFETDTEQKEENDIIEYNILPVALRGLIMGVEALPDLGVLAGQLLINGSLKLVLRKNKGIEGKVQSEDIEIFDFNKLPSSIVTNSLKEQGVDIRNAERGDLLENTVEILTSAIPYITGGGFSRLIADQGIKHATKIAGIETAATLAGAGARTAVEDQTSPTEFEVPGTLAEIAANVATLNAPGLVDKGVSLAKDLTSAVGSGINNPGTKNRAAKILQSQADNPDVAASNLDLSENILDIPPAKLTEDQGLISLLQNEAKEVETSVVNKQKLLAEQAQEEVTETLGQTNLNSTKPNEVLNDSGYPDRPVEAVDNTDSFIKKLRDKKSKFESNMRDRLLSTRAKLEEVVLDVGDSNPKRLAEASVNAKLLIDNAYARELKIETSLWNKVDTTVKVNSVKELIPVAKAIAEIKKKFGVFSDSLPTKHIADIKRMIKSARKGTLSLNNLKQKRTDISSDIMNELGSNSPNKIKISAMHDLDEAILEVMKTLDGKGSGRLTDAIAFSSTKNKVFNQGEVGKTRGFDAAGDVSVREELTLDSLIQKGTQGVVSVDDLFMAVDSPDMINVVSEYMLAKFANIVTDGVNTKSAKSFLNKYSAVLDKVPDVRRQIQDVIDTGIASDSIIRKGEAALGNLTKANQNRWAVSRVLQSDDMITEVADILKSKTSKKQMKQLVNAVKGNEDATNGLRDIISETVIESIITNDSLSTKDIIIPKRMLQTIDSLVVSGLYTKPQVARFRRVVKDIELNKKTSTSLVKTGEPIRKFLGNFLSVMALQKIAPLITKGAGAGSLGISARISRVFSVLGDSLGTEAVQEVVKDAVLNNPKLLSLLLTTPTTVNKAKDISEKITKSYYARQANPSMPSRLINQDELSKEEDNENTSQDNIFVY